MWTNRFTPQSPYSTRSRIHISRPIKIFGTFSFHFSLSLSLFLYVRTLSSVYFLPVLYVSYMYHQVASHLSLCGWEKRLIALNNAEAFRFFFRLAFGDGDEMRPNLLRQQKFRFYDAPMVVYPFCRCPTRCTTTVSIISRWKFLNLLMLQWNQDGPSF